MKRVLLFSGGVDSSALALLWPHDLKLYVNMHTRYSDAEIFRLPHPGVEIVELPLGAWERPDGIIPMRNLFLVTLASLYGEEIAFGAIAGERMLDKTLEFAGMASNLLSFLWLDGLPGRRPQGWTEGKGRIRISLPIVGLTKAQVIARIIQEGHDAEKLARESWSCYQPRWDAHLGTSYRCGECKPCVRNWLAFYANGINLPYDPRPHLEPYLTGRGEESDIAADALGLRPASSSAP